MELKYFIFFIAIVGVIPLTLLLMLSPKWMKVCVFLLPICFWKYQSTAINFLSNPSYKGTALGFEISIIHLLAIALLAAMFLQQWPVKFFMPGISFYFLFFIVCLLSFNASPNILYSSFEILKLITLFISFLALANYLYITHDFDSFLNGVAVLIIINFVISLEMKYLIGGKWQISGIFPHQNSMGMFMCLIGPVYLSRAISKKEYFLRSAFYLCVFFMSFLCTLFTYSRGSIICFPVGCAITIFVTTVFNLTKKTIIVLCAAGVFGIFATCYCVPRIIFRFESAPKNSAETRRLLAITAMNIIKDKPLLGCGVNTWGIVAKNQKYNYFSPDRTYDDDEYISIVETTYLLVGAECGILGLTTLICWYLYYLFQGLYQAFRWRKTEYFYLLSGLVGGFTSNYLQSVLEWVLKQPINFCMLIWCFGIVAALTQNGRENTFLSKLELIAQRKELQMSKNEEAMAAPLMSPEHMP